MLTCHSKTTLSAQPSPRHEMADIFERYSTLLGPIPPAHAKVVRDIINCRTEKLGGHVRLCTHCSHREQSYNSCRNRHCPKCQFLRQQKWIEDRALELLPVEYFHVVFTVPHVLNPLTLQNKGILYDILFKSAAQTLKEVAERKLDAEIGFVAVLHTWGQNLMDHPHLHIIVPGGGLKREMASWVRCKKGYLLPIKILSLVFRGKFLSNLEKAHRDLSFHGKILELASLNQFKKLLVEASKPSWVVYVKKPFAGPEQVINYLGQYTHRIAISNRRILKIEDGKIHFQYRDYADKSKSKIMVLDVKEFMRRFLLHVLPKKFVRIRHYGFLGNRLRKQKVATCKALLGAKRLPEAPKGKMDWKESLKKLTGIDVNICPKCQNKMREAQLILPVRYLANTHIAIDSS